MSATPRTPAVPDSQVEMRRALRRELRARLSAERAELLDSLLGLDVSTLEGDEVMGGATVVDMLVRLAAQDELCAMRILQTSGQHTELERALARRREGQDYPLDFESVLDRCLKARASFLDALATVPDDELYETENVSPTGRSPLALAMLGVSNDASIALRVAAWSRQAGLGGGMGPPTLVMAAMRAARKELLTTVSLVPASIRMTVPLGGTRTLAEILEDLTGFEQLFLRLLLHRRAGSGAERHRGTPKERADHGDAGPLEPDWADVWSNLHSTHSDLLKALGSIEADDFASNVTDPWGGTDTIYMWARGCLLHDRREAAAIRAALNLDWPQRLLR